MRRWGVRGEPVLASPWRWVVVLLGLVFAAAAASATGFGIEPVTWSGVAVAVVGGAVGLSVSITGLLARVRLGRERLVHRELWRTRTVLAQSVQAVRVETVDDRLVWQVSAPVLHLDDGGRVALMALAGVSYGRWLSPLLRRNHTALLEWWGGDPDAEPSVVETPTGSTSAWQLRATTAGARRAGPAPAGPAPSAGDLDGPFRRGRAARRTST